MKNIFFLFDQKDVSRVRNFVIKRNVTINEIVTGIPGVDITSLQEFCDDRSINLIRIEDLIVKFGISQFQISEIAAGVVTDLWTNLDRLKFFSFQDLSFNDSLLNHTALLLHNSFAFELLFTKLVKEGLTCVHCFGVNGQFALLERFDVKTLLRPGLTFVSHLSWLSRQHNIQIEVYENSWIPIAGIYNRIRSWLIRLYKTLLLIRRSIHWNITNPHGPVVKLGKKNNNLLILVRAATELNSIRPVLDMIETSNDTNAVIIVDDLLKFPDATSALSSTKYIWVNLHRFSSIRKAIGILFHFNQRPKVKYQHESDEEKYNFFKRHVISEAILRTTQSVLPELSLFAYQVKQAINAYNPTCIVTMDMVDRWGGVIGELGRKYNIPTVTLQNTVLDKIYYPLPVATDALIVANEFTKNMLEMSNCDASRVFAVGLPQFDSSIRIGNIRLNQFISHQNGTASDRINLLIATQPFVQAFDYNLQLIDDIVSAIPRGEAVNIIIKPHPREDVNIYQEKILSLRQLGLDSELYLGSFEQSLAYANLVISRTSTSLQKSIVNGVPAVAYLRDYPLDIVERLDYLADSFVTKCVTHSELNEYLITFTNKAHRQILLKEFSANRDRYLGKSAESGVSATQAVCDIIKQFSLSRTPG